MCSESWAVFSPQKNLRKHLLKSAEDKLQLQPEPSKTWKKKYVLALSQPSFIISRSAHSYRHLLTVLCQHDDKGVVLIFFFFFVILLLSQNSSEVKGGDGDKMWREKCWRRSIEERIFLFLSSSPQSRLLFSFPFCLLFLAFSLL